MPLYSYKCDGCGSSRDRFFRHSERPDVSECSGCGGESRYVISVSMAQSNDPYQKKHYSSERKNGIALHGYRCNACKHCFDEITDFSKGESHEDKRPCPKCQSEDSSWVPSVRIDRWSERFPYYDRGLGVLLTSKQHRRDICKERGLTPVDGDWDLDGAFREFDDTNEKEEKEYADYCDRLDNHPAFADWRKANDQGRI